MKGHAGVDPALIFVRQRRGTAAAGLCRQRDRVPEAYMIWAKSKIRRGFRT